jgi:hypothetical protein
MMCLNLVGSLRSGVCLCVRMCVVCMRACMYVWINDVLEAGRLSAKWSVFVCAYVCRVCVYVCVCVCVCVCCMRMCMCVC